MGHHRQAIIYAPMPCSHAAQNNQLRWLSLFPFFKDKPIYPPPLLKHNILFSLSKFKIKATSELRTDEDHHELNQKYQANPENFRTVLTMPRNTLSTQISTAITQLRISLLNLKASLNTFFSLETPINDT